MGKLKDSGRIDMRRLIQCAQEQMLANLAASEIFEHPTARGAATERHWIELFNRYLPERYRSTSAFIIDADGNRSRQIDIAVYDRFYSPLLFHHEASPHIPAESVYAVFEVKQTLCSKWIADAGEKAASVRRLRRTSGPMLSGGVRVAAREPFPIVAGILSLDAVWAGPFTRRLEGQLKRLGEEARLDLGCCLRCGSFEAKGGEMEHGAPERSLIWFMFRLLGRLGRLGTAPAVDFSAYERALEIR